MPVTGPVQLTHPTWGECELVRVEGTEWIVRMLSNGKLYRFPPGTRASFRKVDGDSIGVNRDDASPATGTFGEMPSTFDADRQSVVHGLATVRHPQLGPGELLRVEVMDWIVRYAVNGKIYRYPVASRTHLTVVEDRTPDRRFTRLHEPPAASTSERVPAAAVASTTYPALPPQSKVVRLRDPGPAAEAPPQRPDPLPTSPPQPQPPHDVRPRPSPSASAGDRVATPPPPPSQPHPHSSQLHRQKALRVVESIRNGLPPVYAEARQLAVGFDGISRHVRNLLADVDAEGGRAMIIKGAYGQGKTFGLKLLEETALEANFAVVRTEIDATENRLNKPHHIYRDLMSHLRVPDVAGQGRVALTTLVSRTLRELRDATAGLAEHEDSSWASFLILNKATGCRPLSWLLSDPDVLDRPPLMGLLSCELVDSLAASRACHCKPGGPDDWPAFSAGTQGDFASFLLSGVGRLCRFAGYKGLIIVMDEMEKWQDLNWKEQSQAGNLLGGLIWGATAEVGKRGYADHPPSIGHSGRGRYPFTTPQRNHIGIAIAMTPRGYADPETLWQKYGLLEIAHLPELTEKRLVEYCERLAAQYAVAYGLDSPQNGQLVAIAKNAVTMWKRRGELTTRSGVQSVIAAFDAWRDKSVRAG